MYDDPEALDALLAPPTPPGDGAALRQRLLERTLRGLRGRRRRRHLVAAAALLACCAAGLLAPHRTGPAPAPRQRVEGKGPAPGVPGPAAPAPSAVALEWQAVEAAGKRPELYRQAADRYLGAEDDPRSAVRCYGLALDDGRAEDLTISPQDSWLLMAIKDARKKEKRDGE
jgi:hypothetical protein